MGFLREVGRDSRGRGHRGPPIQCPGQGEHCQHQGVPAKKPFCKGPKSLRIWNRQVVKNFSPSPATLLGLNYLEVSFGMYCNPELTEPRTPAQGRVAALGSLQGRGGPVGGAQSPLRSLTCLEVKNVSGTYIASPTCLEGLG